MSRVKRGVTKHARHQKILKAAKVITVLEENCWCSSSGCRKS